MLQAARLALRCSSREHYALAFLDIHLEIARHIEIFVRSVSTLLLLKIFYATISVGLELKLVALAKLHVKIGIASIHASAYAIVDSAIVARCYRIFVCELPYTTEGKERTQTQCRCRMGINKGVTYQNAVFIMLENHFFL